MKSSQPDPAEKKKLIDLFFRVRPPEVALKLKWAKDWALEACPDFQIDWKWSTVFFQLEGRDCLYLGVDDKNRVKIGFVEGSQLKSQSLLEGGDKVFVRHTYIADGVEFKKHCVRLIREAVEVAKRNKSKKIFQKRKTE